jgi:hypothetical protein
MIPRPVTLEGLGFRGITLQNARNRFPKRLEACRLSSSQLLPRGRHSPPWGSFQTVLTTLPSLSERCFPSRAGVGTVAIAVERLFNAFRSWHKADPRNQAVFQRPVPSILAVQICRITKRDSNSVPG